MYAGAVCRNINTSGSNVAFYSGGGVYFIVYGTSANLASSNWYGSVSVSLRGNTSLNAASTQLPKVEMDGGSFTLGSAISCGELRVSSGTLDLNNNSFTATSMWVRGDSPYQGNIVFTPAAPTITLTGSGDVFECTGPSATFSISSGTGTFNLTGSSSKTFIGGGANYSAVSLWNSSSSLTITGSHTFTDIKASAGTTLTLTAGTTTTVASLTSLGVEGNLVTIGSTAAAQYTLAKSGGGELTVTYASISYSIASPSGTAVSSVNGGNNTNWNFGGNSNFFLMCA